MLVMSPNNYLLFGKEVHVLLEIYINYLCLSHGNYTSSSSSSSSSSFICLIKIKRAEVIKFTIMVRRPQESTRLISAVCSIHDFIDKNCNIFVLKVKKLDEEVIDIGFCQE